MKKTLKLLMFSLLMLFFMLSAQTGTTQPPPPADQGSNSNKAPAAAAPPSMAGWLFHWSWWPVLARGNCLKGKPCGFRLTEPAEATDNYQFYVALHNWPAAVADCPTGWHLPTDAEWSTLVHLRKPGTASCITKIHWEATTPAPRVLVFRFVV